MDIIDDFIKNSKLERKSKRKAAKNKEPKETVADVDDISEINIENPVHGDIEFQYDNPDARSEPRFGDEPEFDPEPEIDNEPDFRTFNFRGRQKPKPKSRNLTLKTRLYYIVVAFLITLIVVFFILIMQSLNLENIKELMRGFSGNSNSNANDLYVFEDNTTSDDNPYAADIPEPFIVIEAIEDDYTEPTQSALEENNSLLENVVKTAEATTQNQLNTKPTVKPPAPLPTETRRPPAPTQTPTQPPTVKNETTAEPFIEVTTSEDLTEPGVDIEITTEPTIITDEPTIETEPPSEVESPEPIIDIETDAPTILANPEEYAPEEER
jgi:cytoskeletal protein RodZ